MICGSSWAAPTTSRSSSTAPRLRKARPRTCSGTLASSRRTSAVRRSPLAESGDGAVLSVDGVHTFYGSIEALKGISIDVRPGEIVTLIGANGAGKSTTLRSINGLNNPRRGRIRFQGRDITHLPAHDIVELGISQSPEGRRLFPRMSVLENLLMGTFQRPDRNSRKAVNDDLDRVYSLF